MHPADCLYHGGDHASYVPLAWSGDVRDIHEAVEPLPSLEDPSERATQAANEARSPTLIEIVSVIDEHATICTCAPLFFPLLIEINHYFLEFSNGF